MTFYRYARVSTDGQTLDAQIAALKAAGAERVFSEKQSGAKALAALDAGDVLVVTRLDRLARSTRDLLNVLATVSERGAGFRSLGDPWADTTTPHGRLMLTVLGGSRPLVQFTATRRCSRRRGGCSRRCTECSSRPLRTTALTVGPASCAPTSTAATWYEMIPRSVQRSARRAVRTLRRDHREPIGSPQHAPPSAPRAVPRGRGSIR